MDVEHDEIGRSQHADMHANVKFDAAATRKVGVDTGGDARPIEGIPIAPVVGSLTRLRNALAAMKRLDSPDGAARPRSPLTVRALATHG
ncbi:MAG: hypothetical protein WKF58_14985 [Ilumatobacteraceae bacterium]